MSTKEEKREIQTKLSEIDIDKILDDLSSEGFNSTFLTLDSSDSLDTNEWVDFDDWNIDLTKESSDLEGSSTIIDENLVNARRSKALRETFSSELIHLILEEPVEFGMISNSELLVEQQMANNSLATRNWLNEIFLTNYSKSSILIGILRILGNFPESQIFPQGHTMALAALTHENIEVRECGIRAFETWNSENSIKILSNISIEPAWLNDYRVNVISDIKEN